MENVFFDCMLYDRQRVLLGVISQLNKNGVASKLFLMKTLFLLKEETGYDFYPYKLGPFSQTVYWDLEHLRKNGLVDEDERKVTKKGDESKKDNTELVNYPTLKCGAS